jgi:hypothetical protein
MRRIPTRQEILDFIMARGAAAGAASHNHDHFADNVFDEAVEWWGTNVGTNPEEESPFPQTLEDYRSLEVAVRVLSVTVLQGWDSEWYDYDKKKGPYRGILEAAYGSLVRALMDQEPERLVDPQDPKEWSPREGAV